MSNFDLTFKQYINSKEQLREAVKNTPQRIVEYSIRKYCKIPVGETKDTKQMISLKPKQKIIVEWLYNDVYNPTALNIRFEGNDQLFDEQFNTFWNGIKLQKWLIRNAREEIT